MLMTIIENKEVIVVGNYYAIEAIIKPRLNAAYSGSAYAGYLQNAFQTNPNEDYNLLKSHPNPTVRSLVLRNLEHVESFLEDEDINISNHARFIHALQKPLDDSFYLVPNACITR